MSLSQERLTEIRRTAIPDKVGIEKVLQLGEVEEPLWFFGRRKQVAEAVAMLAHSEQDALITGERGVGKSSLGRLIVSLAGGNLRPLEYYGLDTELQTIQRRRLLADKIAPQAFDAVRIIGSRDDVLDNIYYRAARAILQLLNSTDKLKSFDLEFGGTIAGNGGTIKVGYQRPDPERSPVDTGGRGWFEDAVSEYAKQRKHSHIVVVIDEFDTIPRGAEIIDQIKKHERLKLVLIGIEDQLGDLVTHHASSARELVPIDVPPMSEEEVEEIVEGLAAAFADFVTFSKELRTELARKSAGSPFVCKSLVRYLVERSLRGVTDPRTLRGAQTLEQTALAEALARGLYEIFPAYDRLYRLLVESHPEMAAALLLQIARRRRFTSTQLAESVSGVTSDDVLKYLHWLSGTMGVLKARPPMLGTQHFSVIDPVFCRYVELRQASDPRTGSSRAAE